MEASTELLHNATNRVCSVGVHLRRWRCTSNRFHIYPAEKNDLIRNAERQVSDRAGSSTRVVVQEWGARTAVIGRLRGSVGNGGVHHVLLMLTSRT